MSERRPRLLYIAPALPPAKIPEADHCLRDCLELAARGVDVHILTTRDWDSPHKGVTVHAIMNRWDWSEAPRLWRLLRQLKPDGLFIYFLGSLFGYRSMPTLIPLLARIANRRTRTVVRFSNFGRGGAPGGSLAGRWRYAAMRILGPLRYGSLLVASHHIVVVGDWMLDALRTISARAATKASVICPPPLMFVHSDQATARRRGRARLGVSSDETLVAFFGRLYPGKGIEEFLDAGPELLARNSSLRLGLIGGYYQLGVTWAARPTFEAELSTRIEGLGLQKSIVQSGEYPFEGGEASDLLSAIDIAVLPLPPGVRTNNSSFAALCAHGLPVVGVAARPPEPAILSGENALLIAKAEPGLIASAVLELLEDSRLRGRIASGAKVLARERFNWKTATIRMLELLEFDFRTIEQQESPKEPAAN